jgi:hypothetical protein
MGMQKIGKQTFPDGPLRPAVADEDQFFMRIKSFIRHGARADGRGGLA